MNARQLTILSLATGAMIAGATWIGFTRHPTESSAVLYPALQGQQLSKVQAVRIYQPGNVLGMEVSRVDVGWILKQRNYAADKAKVNALLLSLQAAKLREEKTSNPENYATLGVQDLGLPGASSARVELIGIEPPINLIVGKSDTTAKATYVRRADEAQSWLVDTELTLPTDITAWLQRDMLNIGADRIQEVAVQLSGSPRYSVVKLKRADANFDVTPLPKKRELNSVSAANGVAQALTSLQLDDVKPIAELGSTQSVAQVRFSTFDGLVVDLAGYTVDSKQWITVKASFDEVLAKRFEMQSTTDKVRAESETLNKQLSTWTYAIASYKYDAIFKPVEQLLKKPQVGR